MVALREMNTHRETRGRRTDVPQLRMPLAAADHTWDVWPGQPTNWQPDTAADQFAGLLAARVGCPQMRNWLERTLSADVQPDSPAAVRRWLSLAAANRLLDWAARCCEQAVGRRFEVGVYTDGSGALWEVRPGVDSSRAGGAVAAMLAGHLTARNTVAAADLLGNGVVGAWRARSLTAAGVLLPWRRWLSDGLLTPHGRVTVDPDVLSVRVAWLRVTAAEERWDLRRTDLDSSTSAVAPLLAALSSLQADRDALLVIAAAHRPVPSVDGLTVNGQQVAHWWPTAVPPSTVDNLVAGHTVASTFGTQDPAATAGLLLSLREQRYDPAGLTAAGLDCGALLSARHTRCRRMRPAGDETS